MRRLEAGGIVVGPESEVNLSDEAKEALYDGDLPELTEKDIWGPL